MTSAAKTVKRALLSVSDKTGLAELGKGLSDLGIQLLATGGTANALEEAGLKITRTDTLTGFTELLDGRVKTLHPAIHAGLLAKRDDPAHLDQLHAAHFFAIDLLVVNLYPFEKTVSKEGVTMEEAIENIDIGGVALIRSAGKNHADVAVLTDPADYPGSLEELKANGGAFSDATRRRLALKAFRHTSAYDTAIASFLGARFEQEAGFPDRLVLAYRRKSGLRYGENPHQDAAVYEESPRRPGTLAAAETLHGRELSHNNYLDFDSALSLAHEFDEPACSVIKHRNPCGCSAGPSLSRAIEQAVMADPLSAFGGIIAINRPVDKAAASTIMEVLKQVRRFDGLAAVDFAPEALEMLRQKKDMIILRTGAMPQGGAGRFSMRSISGGLLLQSPDTHRLDPATLKVATKRAPTAAEMTDLLFAWRVVKHVVSNAIVFGRDGVTIGIGAGQVNRVGSVAIAAKMAGEKAKGAAMASDAFFPFPDGVEEAAKAGITAAIQPGGSVRDADVIAAADKHGMSMVLTGIRHFKH